MTAAAQRQRTATASCDGCTRERVPSAWLEPRYLDGAGEGAFCAVCREEYICAECGNAPGAARLTPFEDGLFWCEDCLAAGRPVDIRNGEGWL